MRSYFKGVFMVFVVVSMAALTLTKCNGETKTETITTTVTSWDKAVCEPTRTLSSIVAPSEDKGDYTDVDNSGSLTANDTADIQGETATYNGTHWVYDVSADSCIGLVGATIISGNVQLKFGAGNTVVADTTQLSYLSIRPGAQLNAVGTSSSPIVFTSAAEVGKRTASDWGGIVIHGNAKVNNTAGIDTSSDTEIATGSYGGSNNADNSGDIQYVRIEFAGYEIAAAKEFNGLFLVGVGSGTTIKYVQAHRGSDDGIEIFGGTVSFDHIVLTYNDDDGFDLDEGWSGHGQYFVVAKGSSIGDSVIEYDGLGKDKDRASQSFFSNFTFLGQGAGKKKTLVNVKKNGALVLVNSYFGNFDSQSLTHTSGPGVAPSTTYFASTAVPSGLTDTDGDGYISAIQSNLFEKVTINGVAVATIDGLITDQEDLTSLGTNNWENTTNNDFATALSKYTAPASYWGENGASDFYPSSTPNVTTNYTSTITTFAAATFDLSGMSYVGAFSGPTDTWMDGWTTHVEN